jgi:acetyltransferase
MTTNTIVSAPYVSAQEILRKRQPHLDVFLHPSVVAVIGATEAPNSVGRTLLQNLLATPFGGTVYPVNPKRPSVLGVKAYPSVSALPEKPDLAIIITPAPTVPGVIEDCVKAGIPGAVIISAGFKESGPEGAALEKRISQIAQGKIRIIGPNCLGVQRPSSGFNGSFAHDIALPGSVGFISQSGALGTAILDWSIKEKVGFSNFLSIGSMVDVGWGDLIDYLGDDPETKSILIYMESIGDAKSFFSAAREVSLSKPIIVIKAGRTEFAARAAASHTGAMTGSDDVLEAAFRRCGVLRVKEIADLFSMVEVLAKQSIPNGPKLGIITNAGGPSVLAVDALTTDRGELAPLAKETIDSLNAILPPHWSHNNPVDVLGDASPERYARAFEIVAKDPTTDGLLVILTPQSMSDPTGTAEKLVPMAQLNKPILASWMGGAIIEDGVEILKRAHIPTFPYPDMAAQAFNYMWQYGYNLKGLYETPVLRKGSAEELQSREKASAFLKAIRAENRTLLTEEESKSLCATYGIPTVKTEIAKSSTDAVHIARQMGYPVVLKVYSKTITHKSDVGGVQLNLTNAAEVRAAYHTIEDNIKRLGKESEFLGVTVQPMAKFDGGIELILGSSLDPQFGPVLLFGAGGTMVEINKDRSLGFPPLTTVLARRMMEQTRIYKALKGIRGKAPVDQAALEQLLVRFSELIAENPWIKEMDINPLLASAQGLLALDVRVVLHPPETPEDQLPRPVIRPYPAQYISVGALKNGQTVTFRPIRPEDEPLIARFHETLSEESVYRRYLKTISLNERVAHERLIRQCFNDYDREIALVAENRNPSTGESSILGVGRLSKSRGRSEGDIAVLISDQWQHQNLGMELTKKLLGVAREEKLRKVTARILPENVGMQHICEKLGFRMQRVAGEAQVSADLDLI